VVEDLAAAAGKGLKKTKQTLKRVHEDEAGGIGFGNYRTPEEWAEADHKEILSQVRKEMEGFESGRHDKFSREMERRLNALADEADEAGHLKEYGDALRTKARTYGKRAESNAHKGGRQH
jgi:hypothetical protein